MLNKMLILLSMIFSSHALARNSNEAGTCAATSSAVNCTAWNIEGLTTLDITAVLTDLGSAAATLSLEKNNAAMDQTAVWIPIASTDRVFGSDDLNWAIANAGYRQVRVVMTMGAGSASAAVRLNGKGK